MADNRGEGGRGEQGEADRSLIGDTINRLRDKYQRPTGSNQQSAPFGNSQAQYQNSNATQMYQPQLLNNGQPQIQSPVSTTTTGPSNRPQEPNVGLSSFFNKVNESVHSFGSDVAQRVNQATSQTVKHSHTHWGAQCEDGVHDSSEHRYRSFAPERVGNEAKWYVDGCGYMWAVSRALECASKSIWILDWWLSPELYLRRPPSRFEAYRLDRMLLAAAQRGVRVNIIVYKEVTQALTLCSSHTKHALENLHPNICVFRHPDHLPDAATLRSSFLSSFKNMSLTAAAASKMQEGALKGIYGMNDDVILYWAHHEKLLLVDGEVAFMGGLDLCYGRWDTNDHPIADAHPSNLENILFPGQDFNNARIMDFNDVPHWQDNKLDRTNSSRMGWSDLSLCLKGPAVEDLAIHFVDRWNFIYNEKYDVRKDDRYSRLTLREHITGIIPHIHHHHHSNDEQQQQQQQSLNAPGAQYGQVGFVPPQQLPTSPATTGPPKPYNPQEYAHAVSQPFQAQGTQSPAVQAYPPPPFGTSSQIPPAFEPPPTAAGSESFGPGPGPYFPPPPSQSGRAISDERASTRRDSDEYDRELVAESHRQHHGEGQEGGGMREKILDKVSEGVRRAEDEYERHHGQYRGYFKEDGVSCQIVRSCTKWSHGSALEHSIANAYISVIQHSQHFVYIENQFFITATDDAQRPIKNKIGAAIVQRIMQAHRDQAKYKVIVVMPAVPAFSGDLKDDASLGTRAIMEFQYNSINRGGHSIMETLANQGIDPTQYIRFYNLRNYDRLNASAAMTEAEQQSGVKYEDARKQHDEMVGAGFGGRGKDTGSGRYDGRHEQYQQYQAAAQGIDRRQGLGDGKWDSVSECYMLNGPDIRSVPWENGLSTEMEAFVSEELYVHSKLLIADDRVVICGSANLNDRSQLGYHDSEIAIIIEDPTPVSSYMNGQPFTASLYAATLRRQVFRKHLGLLLPQDPERPDQNFEPVGVPNSYDWNSPEDIAVVDPLSDNFLNLWNSRAATNTDVFGKVFHAVPSDQVRNWGDYDEYYTKYFHAQGSAKEKLPPRYKWGHVVAENFPPGPEGVRVVKDMLSAVKGTLVEMPLLFLCEEDIAVEGVSLNAFTEEVYT